MIFDSFAGAQPTGSNGGQMDSTMATPRRELRSRRPAQIFAICCLMAGGFVMYHTRTTTNESADPFWKKVKLVAATMPHRTPTRAYCVDIDDMGRYVDENGQLADRNSGDGAFVGCSPAYKTLGAAIDAARKRDPDYYQVQGPPIIGENMELR